MTDDDPFFRPGDAGPTVIRPIPGGRRAGGCAPAGPMLPPISPQSHASAAGPLPGAAVDNPLVACATDLLTVAGQLRGSPSHPNPQGLRERLTRQIREFEQCARAKGLDDRVVLPARYVLCALIDESVRDTPWGSQSDWSKQGLLIDFHNETWGGDKFYDALDRLMAFPSGNLHSLELIYLCLAMGFEGRYRVRDGGREQLERVREQLYQTIRTQRGQSEPELSPHWRGLAPQRDPLIHQLPLWVFAGLAALLLLGLFAAFTFALSRDSDPVYVALSALDKGLAPVTGRKREPIARPAARDHRDPWDPGRTDPARTAGGRDPEPSGSHRPTRGRDPDPARGGTLRLGQGHAQPRLRAPGPADRRGPRATARAGPGDRTLGQRPHQVLPLPLQLAPVPGACGVGHGHAGRGDRPARALRRRWPRGHRAAGPGQPPGCRNRRVEITLMPAARRRASSGPGKPTMKRLLGFLGCALVPDPGRDRRPGRPGVVRGTPLRIRRAGAPVPRVGPLVGHRHPVRHLGPGPDRLGHRRADAQPPAHGAARRRSGAGPGSGPSRLAGGGGDPAPALRRGHGGAQGQRGPAPAGRAMGLPAPLVPDHRPARAAARPPPWSTPGCASPWPSSSGRTPSMASAAPATATGGSPTRR